MTLPARRALAWAPFAATALLAACHTPPLQPAPPTVIVPAALRAPANEVLVRTLWADGVQVYECRKAADASFPDWALVGPEAKLSDAAGTPVGRHYAGPTWEATDGSKVVGVVKAKVDAPDPRAIAWLLLETHSTGKPGLFAKVSAIQRVATVGGVAPTTGCGTATIGKQERVPYQAQYAQYAPAP
jgi:phage major head subunit gpT-like protein